MKKNNQAEFIDIHNIFFFTLLYRIVAVILVMLTLPIRHKLPLWMFESFQIISYPLLFYSFFSLIFYKKISKFLQKNSYILFVDLFITIGILQIGGAWRSSYFGYTITSIILFTIFQGKKGAYISSSILIIAAIIKDPSGGLPSFDIFSINDLDMKLGAALLYLTAGLILGYFSILIRRLDALSKAKIEETRKLAIAEEKTRMALELHDGAKSMVTAMIIRMNPMMNKLDCIQKEMSDDIKWLWTGINYLYSELDEVMSTLKENGIEDKTKCHLNTIAEEASRIIRGMTGFSCEIVSDSRELYISQNAKQALRRFLNEALMNAWKHSGEKTGTIILKYTSESLILTVADNGKGFIYETKNTALKSLKHRTKELNGNLFVKTRPGEGCQLTLTLPSCK